MSNIKMCDCGEQTYSYKCSLCIADEVLFSKSQPKQEPISHGGRPMTLRECMEAEEQIYKREWVELTDEEINEWTPEIHVVIRAIQAKLKEKNHG